MKDSPYFKQAQLMLRVMPHVAAQACFAVKGGTAINLYVRAMPRLSVADLYGGKICAALDRQHPRDLFDVKILMENEGVTDEIRTAFVVYLASNSRPMSELLAPNLKDFRQVFEREFARMTDTEVEYEELVAVRERLVETIRNTMFENEKQFLVSIKQGQPDWDLVPVTGIEHLPAIQWKLVNIRRMNKKKQIEALTKLEAVLGL